MRGSVYRGDRHGRDATVTANGQSLLLPAHLKPPGGYGYDWGRVNEGTGWLALALLYDASLDTRTAQRWQTVYAGTLALMHADLPFQLTTADVLRWLVSQYETVERGSQ